ncbi:MAG TPA: class I SAM-dependent methyltransferase [Methanospirillum sp.]|nr:class I SAM-dependent methyltransferase [Methanospirillum sp.]
MQDLKNKIRDEWNNSSGGYDSQHAHGIQTEEERNAWIDLFRTIIPAGSWQVLDVGCGTGEISVVLAEMGHQVSGIDLSEGMLGKAREKATKKTLSMRFSIEDAESLSYADQSFDLVINRHLLWTLPNPKKALAEWKRVLRPGGTVAIIDGLWKTGSLTDQFRKTVANLGVLITEQKNQFGRYYSPDITETLPHPYGMNSDTALSYVRDAGFSDLNLVPMKGIMDIQRKHMPISRRISHQMPYYLITGKKDV